MNTDEAKEIILNNIDNPHLFKEYVEKKLAGDFACEIAKALLKQKQHQNFKAQLISLDFEEETATFHVPDRRWLVGEYIIIPPSSS